MSRTIPELRRFVAEGGTILAIGKGRLIVYGPQVAFRAHPHGTFKLLFNGIHCGASEAVTLRGR